MDVRLVPIDKVIPYARNPRKNAGAPVAKVAASLKEFGFRQPIVVDEGMVIIAGHTRLEAARQLGLAEVPVHVAKGLTKAQAKAYRLADNRTAQEAAWDTDLLPLEFADLNELGFDLGLTGFDPEEWQRLIAAAQSGAEGLTDPDEVPEVPAEPVTRPGDVWQLGPHRLLCGDSTVATDVERLLAGVKPHLMVTDPPYGVEYDPDWRNRADRANGKPYGASAVGQVMNDGRADWREAWALFPGDVAYVWHGMLHSSAVAQSLIAAGFDVRAEIVWAKTRFAISRGHYHAQHESAWYAVRKGKSGHWSGDRSQSTLWQIEHRKSETGHGTQKPVECMRRPIVNNSSAGQAVYEPFSGSGTTIIAAEMEARVCYAVELSPAYVDVAVQRWQGFTGKEATLADDGRTFDAIAAERTTPAAA